MDNKVNGLIIPRLVVEADDKRPVKVYIEGNCFRSGIVEMFLKAGCIGVREVEDADLVVFSGGSDIDPGLYGQRKLPLTHFHRDRDDECVRIFDTCLANNIPMFGICRGMQFLHAMAGGALYQDVRNHSGSNHAVITNNQERFTVSSLHHQLCIVDEKVCVPLAFAEDEGQGGTYIRWQKVYGRVELTAPKHRDLEAAAYPNIRAFAVQGHPELLSPAIARFVQWSIEHIDTLINRSFTFKKEDGQFKPSTKENPVQAVPISE